MQDKEEPPTAVGAQADATGGGSIVAATSPSPTEAGNKAGSLSASPPPPVSAVTKPSILAGRSTTSLSPPPTNVESSPSPTPESHPVNTLSGGQGIPVDPQVASLKAIFPDYDDLILQSVLESVEGNQDRAIDLLLGMSDPNFKSEVPPQVPQPQATQEELDEQLAKRLMLEEQQEAQQQWQMQQQQRPRPQRRTSRTQQGGGEQQTSNPPPGAKDAVTDFQEQFTKIAESGKKTFGTLFSKVKAKIQEFEKPGQGASGSGVQPTWSSTAPSSYYDPNATTGAPTQTNYQPYHGHPSQNTGSQTPPMNTAISQPASFYDPNTVLTPQPTPPTQYGLPNLSEPSQPLTGYDMTPLSGSNSNAAPASASPPAQSGAASATSGSGFATSIPQQGPSPGNPIDGGKLGLLPKRPISLVREPPQAKPQQIQRRDSDDDDLEYAENPFEESKK